MSYFLSIVSCLVIAFFIKLPSEFIVKHARFYAELSLLKVGIKYKLTGTYLPTFIRFIIIYFFIYLGSYNVIYDVR